MSGHAKVRTAIALLIFTVVFTALTVGSYTQKSATIDEPVHLAMGYTALKLHDYRIHPETPPFLRMWAALPLLAMDGVQLTTNSVFWARADKWEFAWNFLYRQNDADHLLYPARFMIVLLGVLLGILLFCWGQELFGFATATVVLGLYALEPNILAHSSLVTTDLGVTCFIFGTLYFLWRSTKSLTLGNLLGLCLFFSLAQVSKTTALLLIPIIVVLLGVRIVQRSAWSWRIGRPREMVGIARKTLVAIMIALLLVLVGYAAIWAVYGFRYNPRASDSLLFRADADPHTREHCPQLTKIVDWLDDHRVLPNALTQGFLTEHARAYELSYYFGGKIRQGGLWYYFPIAFLIKTSLVLIGLFLAGLALCAMRRDILLSNSLFVLLPVAIILGTSMQSALNVGLRHILPIYPFVMLLAGVTVSTLLHHFPRALAIVCVVYLIEVAWIYPNYLAYFNWAVGGPRHGHEVLVDSNIDWGQDLKSLKAWMVRNGVTHINLSYFGLADPAYYGINCTYLPGVPFFAAHLISRPQLPGYVAISVQDLHISQDTEFGRALYGPLLDRKPDAVIGYSIYVYWANAPWWKALEGEW